MLGQDRVGDDVEGVLEQYDGGRFGVSTKSGTVASGGIAASFGKARLTESQQLPVGWP